MNTLSRDELKTLMQKQKGLCVSIFMPTHRAGAETQQNPIRLRNLLRETEDCLIAGGLRAQEVEELLTPAHAILGNGLFWRHQSEGLAMFLSSEVFRHYRLPLGLKELLVVTDRFHIKPLLPTLSGDGQFYVLALSQNEVRLLQGTRQSVSEVDLAGVPENLADALQSDVFGKQLRSHTGASVGGGDRSAMFHGQGAGSEVPKKDNILRYFHQINNGLYELLKDKQEPLVLAGVDYLFPIYREANSYSHLLDEGITGNPEGLSAEKLHRQAWAIVQPYFQKAQEDAVALYRQSVGTGLTSYDVEEIVQAAYHGRVGTLFVAVGLQQWGAFDSDSNEVHLRREAEPGDEDLLDFAAIQTFLNGGDVYAVGPEKVPDNASMAAVFRY
ncbi:MAG: hypothetical protein U9M96_01835 [Thermodesulfobacteriota bacterium]|nr:hypothetical protein [Thermodesulfobacteriota bacterium]